MRNLVSYTNFGNIWDDVVVIAICNLDTRCADIIWLFILIWQLYSLVENYAKKKPQSTSAADFLDIVFY